MAEYLASIFGTEKDKVNCSFYFKIGACRHGDRCSRIHNKPTFSQTVLLQNLYHNPQNSAQSADGSHLANITDEEMQEHFDNFFEDVFVELEDKVTKEEPFPRWVGLVIGRGATFAKWLPFRLRQNAMSSMLTVAKFSEVELQEHFDNFFEDVFVELEEKYGEIEEMNVCDNLGDHLVGNVYIKFRYEEDAEKAVADLNNRWFGGRPIYAELSPVTDFREACCRQYEMGLLSHGSAANNPRECTRSGFCNFMHLKPISRELRRELYGRSRRKKSTIFQNVRRSRSRSPRDRNPRGGRGGGGRAHSRDRSRERRRSRSRERGRSRSKERERSKSREREGRSGRF